MKNKLFISAGIICALFLLPACTQSVSRTNYTVEGVMPDSSKDGKKIHIFSFEDKRSINTTTINGDKFQFEGVADTAKFCSMIIEGAQEYGFFILENGNIKINADKGYGTATGTVNNELYSQIRHLEDSLNREYGNAYGTKAEELKKYKKAKAIELFKRHSNDIIGPILLRTSFIYVFDLDEKISILENFGSDYKDNYTVKTLLTNYKAYKNTSAGQPYKDIKGTGIDGKQLSLSDFIGKGNYVLLDMWASWCGPCKREIPYIAEINNLYKDKGITVLGVFVWDDIQNLTPTMKEKNITWPQIIDSEKTATKLYGVTGIPEIILFAPDGTILERGENMRGAKMKETVEKYLSEK